MFLGKHYSTINNQSRMQIPAAAVKVVSGSVYITQGFDRNLWVLSQDAFEEIYKKITSLNLTDPLARTLLRMILGGAAASEIDESGELTIPDHLRQFAQLETEVIIIGQGDYFEVWAPEFWNQQEDNLQNVDLNTDRFMTLNLSSN
jgi:MraZ protein